MFDYLDFQEIPGKRNGRELKMLALSTCGFCKRAKAFLKEQEIGYSFIDVDTLEKSVRKQIRSDFALKHGKTITYPTLLIGDEDYLVGFIKDSWVSALKIKE